MNTQTDIDNVMQAAERMRRLDAGDDSQIVDRAFSAVKDRYTLADFALSMAEQFEIFAHAVDGEADMAAFDDFDGNMADLYDWADRERVLISK